MIVFVQNITYQFLRMLNMCPLSLMVIKRPLGLLYMRPNLWHARPTVGV